MTAADRPTEPPVECVAVDRAREVSQALALDPGCHEDMGDGPCGVEPVAARIDPGAGMAYPVCIAHVRDDMVPLAALAGSGEQPGPLKAGVMALTGLSSDEVDALGGVREDDRPAPVAPDGGHVLTEYGTTTCPVESVRAEVTDGKCSACGAVVPDSTDVREVLDEWRKVVRIESPDDGVRVPVRDLAAVLAFVGQGVTAEPIKIEWGVVVDDDGTTETYESREAAERMAVYQGGVCEVVRIETWPHSPAVVRSGEQGGEGRG